MRWTVPVAALAAAFLAGLPRPVVGQQDTARARQLVEQRLGREITQEQILDNLRRSGLSRAQVRAQLQRLGYDPSLADQYFDILERDGEAPAGVGDDDFVRALRRIGVLDPGLAEARGPDSLGAGLPDSLSAILTLDTLPLDSLTEDTLPPDSLPIFGKSLFSRRTTQFQPALMGPVDPSYRLGPGDEVVLILTGDVELAYDLAVTRDGSVVIPDVGQVFVAGLTLGQLEDRLYDRLGRVYSGVLRGPEATTHFSVSLGRLRANQVYVVGDAERPGAYQVSSVASVFHALHMAGGPAEEGSFRRIDVRRGERVVRTVDLYDYLVRGDASSDVRLEQGDIVFIPPAGMQVRVEGAVRRPAIYEVLPGETLRDVLRYAGGPDAAAFMRRVQIDRILPPIDRRPGVERVVIDVDVRELFLEEGARMPLVDGDRIQLFAVGDERRNVVTVMGQVRRPGAYEWTPGTTLWQVVDRADGLSETAYTARAHIYRLNESEGTRRLVRTPLLTDEQGQPTRDVMLEDRDSVVIYSRETLRNPEVVAIEGEVKRPGNYPLSAGMTLEDLVLAAGGFTEAAYQLEADVARRMVGVERSDTTARMFRVGLAAAGGDGEAGDNGAPASGDPPYWPPSAAEFELQNGDRVFIRQSPGFEEPRTVTITGEVLLPGKYVLQTRQEQLVNLLSRAGGLTSEAYVDGFQLVRRGDFVATDVEEALQDTSSRYNLMLEDGDSLHVPRFDPTVRVYGAVAFGTRVLYRPGAGLGYYVDRAGGYTEEADKGRVTVTYQDGERAVVGRFLLWTRHPTPGPGSSIFVPEKPLSERQGFDWDRFLSRSLAVVSTMATLLIAINQLD